MGRRKNLEKTLTDFHAANKIKNFPIQGTASDGFKIALCQLDLKFRESGLDAHIVLTLHDEIMVEVKKEKAVQAQGIIEECLEMAFKTIVPHMPFKLDVRIAES